MKRKSLAGPVVKSLIFIVITATVTAVLGISIAHSGVSATVGYQAVFTDVTGLIVGDDVDIAGVRVGDVTSISVYGHDEALVGFAVQPGRALPASATATIKYLNLVGQRYIELGQGTGPVGRALRQGGTIPLAQHHPGAGPDRAVQRLPAAVPGAVPRRRQPAVQRDHPGLPGREPQHHRAGRHRRVADHRAGHQGSRSSTR